MLIQNGIIVTEHETFAGDVRIESGIITEVGKRLAGKDGPVIDASGRYIFPGFVDVHTHFDLDAGIARACDDFYTGTVAAACGGTTAIVDHMAFGPPGASLSHQVHVYHGLADGKAVVDYGFHGVISHVDDGILNEMDILAAKGVTSFKFYMTYGGKLDDTDVLRVMAKAGEGGLMVCAHPENDGALAFMREKLRKEGKLAPRYHGASRPEQCEADAVNRLALFSEMLGDVPVYAVHVSNARVLQAIQEARGRGLRKLFAETCPQYLLLDDSAYERPDAVKFIMSPPLRHRSNQGALWRGLADGSFQTVATDHCPFPFATDKQMGKDDFTKCPNGVPGVELRPLLIYSEGVAKGRVTLQDFVRTCALNPAKLFGLYPKKGTIAPGSDGDIVILNPAAGSIVTQKNLHESVDYTPYEGFELAGRIETVISRGEVIVKDHQFLGQRGRGRFLKRRKPLLEI